MIRENVPAAEADELAAKGGRVLYRRPNPSGEGVVCDVEMPDDAPVVRPMPLATEEEAEPDEA